MFSGNSELGVLGPFLGTWAFLALDARLWRPLFQPAGSDLRPGFLPFENCDLVAQPLNGLFEFANAVLLRTRIRVENDALQGLT